MSLDVAALSAPVSPESPAGENLEYDPVYLKLDELATGVPAKQMGDSIVEGEDPDWAALRKTCLELLARTRDFRVIVYLILAGLRTGGLGEMRDGFLILKAVIDGMWDVAWPRLDPDDGNDPTERMNILSALSPQPGAYQDPVMFLQRLRGVPLCDSRQMGRFSLRDLLIAGGDISSPEGQAPVDMSVINAAFLDTDQAVLKANSAAIDESVNAIGDIAKTLNDKAGSNVALSFLSLLADLKKIDAALKQHIQTAAPQGQDQASPSSAGSQGQPSQAASQLSAASGDIRSRDDALAVMEKICKFYERSEPNSPVPYLLKRAIRVAKMDFISLMQEINPDGLGVAKNALGVKDQVKEQA